MIYFCALKQRRDLVLTRSTLNGIDYAELLGDCPGRCTQLAITFLRDARGLALGIDNVSVTGTTPLNVVRVDPASNADPLVVVVTFSDSGDFSPYTLKLVATPHGNDPPAGFDPALSMLTFSFKADCPSPADCLPSQCCATPAVAPPDINYLAKDYPGFVQVMLDRMAALTPGWTETHAADMGVALVEALAYAADHLSYQQDAVSTEAYLGTARSRISLRRHARLVDYPVGEGCNARAWIFLNTQIDNQLVPAGTPFYVRTPGVPAVVKPKDLPHVAALQATTQPVFVSQCDVKLQIEQNIISFYTWSDTNCCLPAGATAATLSGNLSTLGVGSVLVFEEQKGPLTGDPSDADPTHRWAVRLTRVRWQDDAGYPLVDPYTPAPISEVEWAVEDALPFPLCLSSSLTTGALTVPIADVSVAHGNLVPADHGLPVTGEVLGVVPEIAPSAVAASGCTCDDGTTEVLTPPLHARFYPELAQTMLTFAPPYAPTAPASMYRTASPSTALPQITVTSADQRDWTAVPDLLDSDAEAPHFVPEIEADGSVHLRFGDGKYGAAPPSCVQFTANYRVGNGSAGNVGYHSIAHMIWNPDLITIVRNPLDAAGGVDPESMEHIRQYAPFSFQVQARCVTEDDYSAQASTLPGIEAARGTLRWTGSWYSAFVSIEPDGALTPSLVACTRRELDLLRMLGVDVAVEPARIVGLVITLRICTAPDHFRGDVYSALMRRFITGDQCNGQPGLLDPANFVFGQTIYASPLVAAAQAVDGVISATLVQFGRLDQPWVDGVSQGYLTLGRIEIAGCDNDPNHLDRGTFTLLLDGGK